MGLHHVKLIHILVHIIIHHQNARESREKVNLLMGAKPVHPKDLFHVLLLLQVS